MPLGALLLGVALPWGAQANMRAPQSRAQPSSAALQPAMGLVVLGETLRADCTPAACEVQAHYRVQAAAAQVVTLAFVLPDGVPVHAHINQQATPATVTVAQGGTAWDAWAHRMDARIWPWLKPVLHQAQFEGALHAGINDIIVRYTQPLATQEREWGYFTKSRWVSQLRYELWPLKQWTLAEGFVLDAVVTLQPAPGSSSVSRLWGRAQALRCRTVLMPADAQEAAEGQAQPHHAWTGTDTERSAQWSAQTLPDRLLCDMGDEDLL